MTYERNHGRESRLFMIVAACEGVLLALTLTAFGLLLVQQEHLDSVTSCRSAAAAALSAVLSRRAVVSDQSRAAQARLSAALTASPSPASLRAAYSRYGAQIRMVSSELRAYPIPAVPRCR